MATVTIKLYQYQQEDVDKLAIKKYGLIGSEMGTGKTHEAIALIPLWLQQSFNIHREIRPILIVTPINTFPSWEAKLDHQLPNYSHTTIDPKNRKQFIEDLKYRSYEIYIMHPQALRLCVGEFDKNFISFSIFIFDEVHAISNRGSQTTKASHKVKTDFKLGMSGTASGNKPWNLWSVLHWLDKRRYSSYWKFIENYVEQAMEYNGNGAYRVLTGVKNIEFLHKSIEGFYIRHLKKCKCCEHHPNGVQEWLPDKVYETITVELSDVQRNIYNQMAKKMVAFLESGQQIVAPIVIAQLIRLGQIALATPVITSLDKLGEVWDNESQAFVTTTTQANSIDLDLPSSKYDALYEILTDYEDKSFVVYSSSKKMVNLTVDALNASGVKAMALTGDTPMKERLSLTKDFNDGKFRVIVAVIAAAAVGIDGLQHTCDTVIFLDRMMGNNVLNKQAEDRLHRDGQKNTVTVIDIEAANTLEQARNIDLANNWQKILEILNVR